MCCAVLHCGVVCSMSGALWFGLEHAVLWFEGRMPCCGLENASLWRMLCCGALRCVWSTLC